MTNFTGIKIEPDYEAFKANILRKGTPERVHFMELFQDDEIKDLIAQQLDLDSNLDKNEKYYPYKREVAIQKALGYDIVSGTLEPQLYFPSTILEKRPAYMTADTTSSEKQSRGTRQWSNEHKGAIGSWRDFEEYPWPDPETMDVSSLEWAEKNLEENMKVYLPCSAIYEFSSQVMGYEQMCYKLADNPNLVDAVINKMGELRLKQAKIYCDFDCVGMLFGGDDFGYKTSLFISKDFLVEKVFPWYKKIVDLAHNKGKLFILHSCGNLESIMDELIDDVGIDGKQSFEDVITPVTEAKRLYGDRIAVIGGMDMDFMCIANEQQIRQRVRDTLDVCMPGGGYCMGTGNTVANYIPLQNYLTMLDESRRYTV